MGTVANAQTFTGVADKHFITGKQALFSGSRRTPVTNIFLIGDQCVPD